MREPQLTEHQIFEFACGGLHARGLRSELVICLIRPINIRG